MIVRYASSPQELNEALGLLEAGDCLQIDSFSAVAANTEELLEMAEKVVNRSYELFGGMWGPFCLETVVTDKLEFKVFEISTRIVAGSNPFISGSPYADLIYPGLSTGGRIALELKNALKDDTFSELMT